MNNENINLVLENQTLKNEFVIRNLNLDEVFYSTREDLNRENRCLRTLLDWVDKYKEYGSREKMEEHGYLFPPIDPGISPENDWFLFKRWLNGQPLVLPIIDQLQTHYIQKNPDELSDHEIKSESVKQFVQPRPVSLDILRKYQAEEDEEIEKYMQSKDDNDNPHGFTSFDSDDDLPF